VAKLRPIIDFIRDEIESHKKTFQEGTNRDLIDCYLDAINKASGSSSFVGNDGSM